MTAYILRPLYWKIRFQLWFTKADAYTVYLLERYINWRVEKVQAKESGGEP